MNECEKYRDEILKYFPATKFKTFTQNDITIYRPRAYKLLNEFVNDASGYCFKKSFAVTFAKQSHKLIHDDDSLAKLEYAEKKFATTLAHITEMSACLTPEVYLSYIAHNPNLIEFVTKSEFAFV